MSGVIVDVEGLVTWFELCLRRNEEKTAWLISSLETHVGHSRTLYHDAVEDGEEILDDVSCRWKNGGMNCKDTPGTFWNKRLVSAEYPFKHFSNLLVSLTEWERSSWKVLAKRTSSIKGPMQGPQGSKKKKSHLIHTITPNLPSSPEMSLYFYEPSYHFDRVFDRLFDSAFSPLINNQSSIRNGDAVSTVNLPVKPR